MGCFMFITVHLAPAALPDDAQALEGKFRDTLAALRLKLEPLHPGSTDPELAGQFYAVVDAASADEMCSRLRKHPAVLAAYTKPDGAPPSSQKFER